MNTYLNIFKLKHDLQVCHSGLTGIFLLIQHPDSFAKVESEGFPTSGNDKSINKSDEYIKHPLFNSPLSSASLRPYKGEKIMSGSSS